MINLQLFFKNIFIYIYTIFADLLLMSFMAFDDIPLWFGKLSLQYFMDQMINPLIDLTNHRIIASCSNTWTWWWGIGNHTSSNSMNEERQGQTGSGGIEDDMVFVLCCHSNCEWECPVHQTRRYNPDSYQIKTGVW